MGELCRIVRHLGSGIQRAGFIRHPVIKNDSSAILTALETYYIVYRQTRVDILEALARKPEDDDDGPVRGLEKS